jgi:hypothetical protein
MAELDDVRRIAERLPETTLAEAASGRTQVMFRGKLLAWTWLQGQPKGPRLPNPDLLAVRVSGHHEKEELLASEPEVFFTEPHYDGYPAVPVRLDAIQPDELAELVTDAWRLRAPKRLQREVLPDSS